MTQYTASSSRNAQLSQLDLVSSPFEGFYKAHQRIVGSFSYIFVDRHCVIPTSSLYRLSQKIPSEMEVNLLHCFHSLHYLHYLHYLKPFPHTLLTAPLSSINPIQNYLKGSPAAPFFHYKYPLACTCHDIHDHVQVRKSEQEADLRPVTPSKIPVGAFR